ncbi:MAG: DUF1249 domain-containing protein [Gammaproteobacteria bacterium]
MTHILARAKPINPMWYFERNFNALMKILSRCGLIEDGLERISLSGNLIEINLLERSRYTLLVAIRQRFTKSGNSRLLNDIQFKVRLYLDAKLAEVVSYQGHNALQPRYPYPNQQMYYPDEKRQVNLVLYDWLLNCSQQDFNEFVSA